MLDNNNALILCNLYLRVSAPNKCVLIKFNNIYTTELYARNIFLIKHEDSAIQNRQSLTSTT